MEKKLGMEEMLGMEKKLGMEEMLGKWRESEEDEVKKNDWKWNERMYSGYIAVIDAKVFIYKKSTQVQLWKITKNL